MKKMVGYMLLAFLFLTACGPAKPETVIYEHSQEMGGMEQTVRQAVTYQGKEFQKLDVTVSQAMEDSLKAAADEQDFQTVKDQLLAFMESNQTVQDLKAMNGVTVSIDLTEDYRLVFHLVMDMKTVDVEALENMDEFGVNLSTLSETSPQDYIDILEKNGAKKVTK